MLKHSTPDPHVGEEEKMGSREVCQGRTFSFPFFRIFSGHWLHCFPLKSFGNCSRLLISKSRFRSFKSLLPYFSCFHFLFYLSSSFLFASSTPTTSFLSPTLFQMFVFISHDPKRFPFFDILISFLYSKFLWYSPGIPTHNTYDRLCINIPLSLLFILWTFLYNSEAFLRFLFIFNSKRSSMNINHVSLLGFLTVHTLVYASIPLSIHEVNKNESLYLVVGGRQPAPREVLTSGYREG